MAREGIRRLVEAVAARIPHFAGVVGSWSCILAYADNAEECDPPQHEWNISCKGYFYCDGDGPPQKYGCTTRYFQCGGVSPNAFICGNPDPGESYGCGSEGGLFNCKIYEDKFTCTILITFECYGGTATYACDYGGGAYHCAIGPIYDCDGSSDYNAPC